MLELCGPRTILSDTRPIIRPCLVPVRPQANHRLNSETHPWLCNTNSLVLRIMRYIGRAVEELVYAVTTVGLNHTAPS